MRNRQGKPEEVAAAIAKSVSERASLINGSSLLIDGGSVQAIQKLKTRSARSGDGTFQLRYLGSGRRCETVCRSRTLPRTLTGDSFFEFEAISFGVCVIDPTTVAEAADVGIGFQATTTER